MWLLWTAVSTGTAAVELWVSPGGNDADSGSREHPFATLHRVQAAVRAHPARGREPITVQITGGVYRFDAPLVFTPEDSGSEAAPVVYRRHGETPVVLSGGFVFDALEWRPWRDGILRVEVPRSIDTDQLFVDGRPMPLARYPDFDPAAPVFNGTAADAISPERVGRWQDPAGGFLHALHRSRWGGLHFRILGNTQTGRCASKEAGRTTGPRSRTRSFVSWKTFWRSWTRPESGIWIAVTACFSSSRRRELIRRMPWSKASGSGISWKSGARRRRRCAG
ncbi:MAG: hypothetical protein D6781_14670 [Verrucomicrobia bacterium]|nr:MAG: hypothetical protein D6781_14670 [Verrucomicrobiota bacterium]